MDKASQASCNNGGNTVLNSRSTQSVIGNGGSYAVLDTGHAPNPTDATFQDSSPQSRNSDTVWSTTAQIDDNETFASTRDFPASPIIDSELTEARLRDTCLPKFEEIILKPERMNQQCCCGCHAQTFDQSTAPPQQRHRVVPLERYTSQAFDEECAVAYWSRRNVAQCKICKCHIRVYQTSDKDENPEGHA